MTNNNPASYFIVTDLDYVLVNYPLSCKTLEQAEAMLVQMLDSEPRGGYRIVAAKEAVK